ncbi:MAG: hypothetical protein ACT4PV_11650 [Planctomycetaceae bacterium]
MKAGHRPPRQEGSYAAVAGGAVTRERLRDAAAREGRDGSPLVRALLARSLPATSELARSYESHGGIGRIGSSPLKPSAAALRLLDPELLRRHRCLPLELFEELCLLAVDLPSATEAVTAVRRALGRDIVPVVAPRPSLDRALATLAPPSRAVAAPLPKSGIRLHDRFRSLAMDGDLMDALPGSEDTPCR